MTERLSDKRMDEIRHYVDGLPNLWTKGYEYVPDLLDEVERLRAALSEADAGSRQVHDRIESVTPQVERLMDEVQRLRKIEILYNAFLEGESINGVKLAKARAALERIADANTDSNLVDWAQAALKEIFR